MKRILAAGASALLLAAWGAAFAQAFPSKPVTLICPWPAGGGTGLHLRKLAELASKQSGCWSNRGRGP